MSHIDRLRSCAIRVGFEIVGCCDIAADRRHIDAELDRATRVTSAIEHRLTVVCGGCIA